MKPVNSEAWKLPKRLTVIAFGALGGRSLFLAPAIARPRPDDKARRQLRRKSRARRSGGNFQSLLGRQAGKAMSRDG
jgi:hypothetical protein